MDRCDFSISWDHWTLCSGAAPAISTPAATLEPRWRLSAADPTRRLIGAARAVSIRLWHFRRRLEVSVTYIKKCCAWRGSACCRWPADQQPGTSACLVWQQHDGYDYELRLRLSAGAFVSKRRLFSPPQAWKRICLAGQVYLYSQEHSSALARSHGPAGWAVDAAWLYIRDRERASASASTGEWRPTKTTQQRLTPSFESRGVNESARSRSSS